MSIKNWLKSLIIFAEHAAKGFDEEYIFDCEHDEMFGPSLPLPESEDGKKLEAYGWNWNTTYDCWHMFV